MRFLNPFWALSGGPHYDVHSFILSDLITPRHNHNKENEMETMTSIVEWHTKTFPDATLEGQREKFKEEFQEYLDAIGTDSEQKELADMFIVACGISRFISSEDLFSLIECMVDDAKEFQKIVTEKMKLNRKRKWDKGNGEYKHIGVDNG